MLKKKISTWILADTHPRESRRESIRGFAPNFYPCLFSNLLTPLQYEAYLSTHGEITMLGVYFPCHVRHAAYISDNIFIRDTQYALENVTGVSKRVKDALSIYRIITDGLVFINNQWNFLVDDMLNSTPLNNNLQSCT